MSDTTKIIASSVLFFALAIGYMMWLDSGCELSGAMTWQGKICIE